MRGAPRVALALLLLGPLALAVPASAAEDATAGWWYQPQRQTGVAPAQVPAPAYVPAGDLLVEGALTGENAVAALRLLVPAGRRAGRLVLPVTSTRGVPDVAVCRTRSGWGPAEVGSFEQRPLCDDGPRVALMPSADGDTLVGDVASLVRDGVLDVLLAPRVDDAGRTGLFSVTLTDPTTDVLTLQTQTTTAAAPEPVAEPAPAPAVRPVPPPDVVPAPFVIPPAAAELPDAPPFAPAPPAEAAPPTVPLAGTPLLAPAPAVALPRRMPDGADRARTVALLLLAATGIVAAVLSRGTARLPRPLVGVAGAPAPTPDAPQERGVGRFRSARTGTPPVRI